MSKIVKCYRCGKEINLNPKELKTVISCPHCHGKMTITKKTYRQLRIVRYFFVLAVCALLMFGLSRFDMKVYYVTFLTIIVAVSIAMLSDNICLWLQYKIFGLNFEEYHPTDKKAKGK